MSWQILQGDVRDVLQTLPDQSVQCCVTSPPYWGLRDYGTDGQIGLEATPDAYVAQMVQVFAQVKRVLKDDGTLWLNLGDSYATSPGKNNANLMEWSAENAKGGGRRAGLEDTPRRGVPSELKPKDLCGIPWRVALELQSDGWYLRSDIIWSKPNPMPESVTDRPTKAHEYIFLLTKSSRYFYDADAVAETSVTPEDVQMAKRNKQPHAGQSDPGGRRETTGGFDKITKTYPVRNARTVWDIATQPYPEAHFATFPEAIPERCIKAGSKAGDTVLDPFCGAGTTGLVADRLARDFIGIELNATYRELARKRISEVTPLFPSEQEIA